ncbi:hypothetical protein PL9631_970042 [Planktothrix paucivesiculata PCC 9631]|uniref:Uncharacterized protein n=1 Tax=Planktothrix paucivesiculata PCC 9631 TaxID=671071 RepID=A0A7Z9C1Q0_9CYAN|nr:hypothetical protein PL9631_970042 [Planktothrix paucivesiculata PCC 9631]
MVRAPGLLTLPSEVKRAKVEIATSGSDFFCVEFHTCWFGAECGAII